MWKYYSTIIILEFIKERDGDLTRKVILGMVAIIFLIMVMGCSAVVVSDKSSNVAVVEDYFFLVETQEEEKEWGNLYYQQLGKERKKMAGNVLNGAFRYSPVNKTLIYVDKEKNLHLQLDDQGTQLVTTEVWPYFFELAADGSAFTFFRDGESIDFYVQAVGQEREKINSPLWAEQKLMADGSGVFYITDDSQLYLKKLAGEKEKIASDVDFFHVSGNGQTVVYLNKEGLYLRHLTQDDQRKLTDKAVVNSKISWDGQKTLFLADYNYVAGKGELFAFKDNQASAWVASDITDFAMDEQGETVYYLNDDQILLKKNLTTDESKRIGNNVLHFIVNFPQKLVAYLDGENNLFVIKGQQDSEKVAEHVQSYSFYGDTVVYLNDDDQLMAKKIGQEKQLIAADVLGYQVATNMTSICYYNKKDELYLQVGSKTPVLMLEDLKKYQQIYFSNMLIYENNLTLRDLVGFWQEKENDLLLEIRNDGQLKITDGDEWLEVKVEEVVSATETNLELMVVHEDGYYHDSIICEINKDNQLIIDEFFFTKINREEFTNKLAALELLQEKVQQSYEKLYQYNYIPAEIVMREEPSVNGTIMGSIERGEYYFTDFYIDDALNIWYYTYFFHESTGTWQEGWIKNDDL